MGEEARNWLDTIGEDGQPLPIEGQVAFTGPAGSCLINNTDIWHTNTANIGPDPRRLAMVLYKPGWMKQWDKGYDITDEFASRPDRSRPAPAVRPLLLDGSGSVTLPGCILAALEAEH